ncbi:MAG TPA: histidine phosphatase family protein [Pirellulales bacterium]|nr:histidine phosphatase family protein [Pirellulales bacterium]
MKCNDGNSRRVILVRHGCVAERYHGICYGSSDIELSDEGHRQTCALAAGLSALDITHLFHSGLARARLLAEMLAGTTGLEPVCVPALREINFGHWELRSWEDIFAEVGEAMAGLIQAPATFRPPAGETAYELRDRVLDWYGQLPREGTIVAVAHGGPIAALRGSLADIPVAEWPALVPAYGEWVELDESRKTDG